MGGILDEIRRDIKRMSFEQVTLEMREREAEAANAYNRRWWDLWQTRKPAAGNGIVKNLDDIEKLAARLPAKRSSAPVLQDYYNADNRLSVIEQLLSDAVAVYDEEIDAQVHSRLLRVRTSQAGG
jgi:hypothetical protein